MTLPAPCTLAARSVAFAAMFFKSAFGESCLLFLWGAFTYPEITWQSLWGALSERSAPGIQWGVISFPEISSWHLLTGVLAFVPTDVPKEQGDLRHQHLAGAGSAAKCRAGFRSMAGQGEDPLNQRLLPFAEKGPVGEARQI